MRGEYPEAESVYKQTLARQRAKLEANHPDLLGTLQQLASVYLLQQRYEQAEPLFKEVLAAQRATLTAKHPETIATMTNLGVLYRDVGRFQESDQILREAIARSRETNGLGHPSTHTAIAHFAALQEKQGTPQLSEPILRELVTYLRDHPGLGSYLYANELGELAGNLLAQKKYSEAEPFARDCLAIRQKNRPNGWTTFYTKSMIGESLLGQKKYAAAEPFLLEGYSGMKEREAQIPQAGKPELTSAWERVVELYESWGQPKKAAEWRTKLPKAAAEKSKQR
jgi:tetratricopeptide (TPR) repeat protein